MTNKEIFQNMIDFAKENKGLNKIYYLSGTKNKKTILSNMVKRYKEDAALDFEIGVLTQDEYNNEKEIIKILENSIKFYNEF